VPEKHLPLPHISNADTCKNAEALIRTLTFGQTHRHAEKQAGGVGGCWGEKLGKASFRICETSEKKAEKPSPRRF